ncbi:hypothetical protein ZIOFF_030575 [Zingiber officinale]|uniref:NAD(P)-binding domain-containing protein n=1 Tax=Zingiber officinale TaxID=94328 RepID=A0A8J5H4T4_ZINOF|nr:hypothetical protein ZIOFF_030575 [Zingiber officinale]
MGFALLLCRALSPTSEASNGGRSSSPLDVARTSYRPLSLIISIVLFPYALLPQENPSAGTAGVPLLLEERSQLRRSTPRLHRRCLEYIYLFRFTSLIFDSDFCFCHRKDRLKDSLILQDGFFSDVARTKGVNHIVLLSQLRYYKGSGGFQAIMNSKARELADRDEKAVITAGVPYTLIRTGLLQSVPSGDHAFSFSKGDAAKGNLSKEDAAVFCVEALESPPEEGLIFQVANGEEKVTDWKVKFAALIEGTGVLQ